MSNPVPGGPPFPVTLTAQGGLGGFFNPLRYVNTQGSSVKLLWPIKGGPDSVVSAPPFIDVTVSIPSDAAGQCFVTVIEPITNDPGHNWWYLGGFFVPGLTVPPPPPPIGPTDPPVTC